MLAARIKCDRCGVIIYEGSISKFTHKELDNVVQKSKNFIYNNKHYAICSACIKDVRVAVAAAKTKADSDMEKTVQNLL